VTIKREPAGGLVTIRTPRRFTGQDTHLNELLQRNGGFLPERRRGGTVMVLPAHLSFPEQQQRASRAAATLELLGRKVSLARELRVPGAEPDLDNIHPRLDVRQIGTDIGEARGSDEVAALLLEISGPSDGVLTEAASVLESVGWWWIGAQPLVDCNPYLDRLDAAAKQLRSVAAEVNKLRTVLGHLNRDREPTAADTRTAAAAARSTAAVPRGTGPTAAAFQRTTAGATRAHRP